MEKIQSTISTMKTGYYLFNYHISYLTDNLDYKPPGHKSVTLFGTLVGATSRTPQEIKLSIPIDDSVAGGFDYTLKVANVTNNKSFVFFH